MLFVHRSASVNGKQTMRLMLGNCSQSAQGELELVHCREAGGVKGTVSVASLSAC